MKDTVKMNTDNAARKLPLALIALLISAFAIGTTEFVIMGILPDVANDLHVTISAAGMLVTGYALGVAVGGPIITSFTGRLPRKWLLFGLMVIFIAGNVLSALADNYTVLMIARVVTSLAHGTFFGIGSVVASRLVPKEKQASAIALMFTGLTLSNILGVPFGTFIGQTWGWRATFWVVTILGFVSLIGIVKLIPGIQGETASGFRQEFGILAKKEVWFALLVTVLSSCGLFTVFTYIAPILTDISGFAAVSVTPILLLFGIGTTIGNTIGGKLADWRLMPSLVGILALLACILAILSLTSHYKISMIITVFIWGFASFAISPALQMRVLSKAKESPNIASSLNISAFNVGNAAGAFLGGWAIDSGLGLNALPWAAAIVTAAGILVSVFSWSLDQGKTIKPAKASQTFPN